MAEAGFCKNIARDGKSEKSETTREDAGESKEKKYPPISDNTFLQLSKNVGEPMLERFWAAWESQKRIDSQRYQARPLPELQPPVREPICGLDGLGFLKSFFVILTEKDMTPSARTPLYPMVLTVFSFVQVTAGSSAPMLDILSKHEFWFRLYAGDSTSRSSFRTIGRTLVRQSAFPLNFRQ